MNKVKRAIILAAGKGTRLRPITNNIPKPLIEVNGVKMIESIIESLHYNGIYEIYVVVGYLKEKFKVIQNKYQDIIIIENPDYNCCNNISSLYVARNYIEDCFILDADQIIYNKEILNPNFEKSGYSCSKVKNYSNEWILHTENKNIVSCDRNGGTSGWRLFSLSRWSKQDGRKLKKYLEIEFKEKNEKQLFWDDIALFCYPREFDLQIYEINDSDIVEIDNLDELIELDKIYINYKKDGDMYEK